MSDHEDITLKLPVRLHQIIVKLDSVYGDSTEEKIITLLRLGLSTRLPR